MVLSHLYEYVRLSKAKKKNQLESHLGIQKLWQTVYSQLAFSDMPTKAITLRV